MDVNHNSRFLVGLKEIVEKNVPGDFFDIGCWKGTLSFYAALFFKENDVTDRKIYLFDTFEGHPENQKEEIDKQWGFDSKLDYFKNTSIDDIVATFEKLKFNNYQIVKGDIFETLPKTNTKIAFATTDLNHYVPTKFALEYLCEKLSDQGMIFEDDYGNIQGINLAIDELINEGKIKRVKDNFLTHGIRNTTRL